MSIYLTYTVHNQMEQKTETTNHTLAKKNKKTSELVGSLKRKKNCMNYYLFALSATLSQGGWGLTFDMTNLADYYYIL